MVITIADSLHTNNNILIKLLIDRDHNTFTRMLLKNKS